MTQLKLFNDSVKLPPTQLKLFNDSVKLPPQNIQTYFSFDPTVWEEESSYYARELERNAIAPWIPMFPSKLDSINFSTMSYGYGRRKDEDDYYTWWRKFVNVETIK